MIPFIKNAILTGVSYLSSNKVPPNTTPEKQKRLRSINHMESKKFYIVLTSVIILAFFYFGSVGIKYGSTSSAALEGTIHVEKTENITVIHTNAKEDDYELN